jgi:UDP-N-acetylmuramyl tripeptide synthase
MIWDEIGESDTDRDNMLLQLEQECLDIYHKKVEETRKHKADLFKWLADAESEVTNIASSLGDCAMFSRVRSIGIFFCTVAVSINTANVIEYRQWRVSVVVFGLSAMTYLG